VSDTERDLDPSEGGGLVPGDGSHEADPAPPTPTPPRRRRPDVGLLVACFVIACGLAFIAWGVTSAITGTDGIDRPDAIEELSPVENAQQVFQQEQIVVDLEFGYEAVLVVDGIELPTERIGEFSGDLTPETAGQQVSTPPTAVFDPGNSVISFRPTDGALIESFSEGRHQAQVIFWKSEDGRASARSYRWSFEVV
jgi:hypothetical protein